MAKSVYLTDEQYAQVAAAAVACGFEVKRGRGSELAKFVVFASESAVNSKLVVLVNSLANMLVDAAGKGYVSGNDLDFANDCLDKVIPLLPE